MDSLTQIVLGAAAGEVVLGKKIGNRAMVWGAVGGTIPDLDVLGDFFLSNIDNLAFHRGISHSILFSVVGALIFGCLVQRLYKNKYHKWIAIFFKALAAILVTSALNFVLQQFFPGNYVPTIVVGLGITMILVFSIKRRYFSGTWTAPTASVRDWQWLFFWSLFTHPILDCFTIYGTQLFAPFTDTRVAWSTISVVDPIYTIPFLLCLIVASFYHRESKSRRVWNYIGLTLSCTYLLFTVFNKQFINSKFTNALQDQSISAERYITNPFILNNIVWNATVETKDAFYQGQYSLFDEVDIEFTKLNKNHNLLNTPHDHTIEVLKWFSDEYYNVIPRGDSLQFNDLRFGTFSGTGANADDYIFKFILTEEEDGTYQMEEAIGGPPDGSQSEIFASLWKRIKGKKRGVPNP